MLLLKLTTCPVHTQPHAISKWALQALARGFCCGRMAAIAIFDDCWQDKLRCNYSIE
jgi:hypothetical protein